MGSEGSGRPVKGILGYDIVDGVSIEEYERWMEEIHLPDLLSNPYLDRVVLDDVVRPITTTSAGTTTSGEPTTFYRISELHFADMEAYEKYLEYFRENPIPVERSPAGRTEFRFYVLCEVGEATRESLGLS